MAINTTISFERFCLCHTITIKPPILAACVKFTEEIRLLSDGNVIGFDTNFPSAGTTEALSEMDQRQAGGQSYKR